jgi:hypothetical protein
MMIPLRGLGSTADDIIAQYQAEFSPTNPFVLNNPSLLQDANSTILNALDQYCGNNPGDTSSCSGSQPLPQYVQQASQISSAIPAPLAAAAAAGQTTPIATPGTTTANNPGPVLTIGQENGCAANEAWDPNAFVCMSCSDLDPGEFGCPSTKAAASPSMPSIPTPVIPISTPVTIQPTQGQIAAATSGVPATTASTSITGSGFVMPAFLTEESIGGIQNWVLLAGGIAALLILPGLLGGRK